MRACDRVIGALALLALSACATDEQGRSVNVFDDIQRVSASSDQNELDDLADEYSETRLQGLAVGCVGGAVLGGVVGALIGGAEGVAAGTSIAALGCAAGYGAGAFVANKDSEARLTREELNADIVEARERADHYERAAGTARRVVDANQAKIADLNRQYRANALRADAYREQLAPMARDVEHLEALIEQTTATIDGIEQASTGYQRNGLNPAQLQQQRARLASERRALEAERDRLETALLGVPADVGSPLA